jgi:hypothetical protein
MEFNISFILLIVFTFYSSFICSFRFSLLTRRSRFRTSIVRDNIVATPWVDSKDDALRFLDYMTSATDVEDPDFDLEKDELRESFIARQEYSDLHYQCQKRGIDPKPNIREMIVQLLVYSVDPTIKFKERYLHFSKT